MGTLINLVSTKQQTSCHTSQRFWVPVFSVAEMNGLGMMTLLSNKRGFLEVVLVFFHHEDGHRKTVRVKPGQWVNEVQPITGLKVLPLAIECNKGSTPRVFIEVAITRHRLRFVKDIIEG